ncbi:MAG: efflux RND transporter periplasmic adaptor subunit [Candidatus Binataceae bacterium]|nr:efflux RND transporter periplasmic adaptor subunit [Candidatus Binataceae bacterium]
MIIKSSVLRSLLSGAVVLAALTLCSCGKRVDSSTTPAEPIVSAIHPQRGLMTSGIELPGDVVGFYEAALHAKVTGYLKWIAVDKGDWVKQGQVLAEIQVPELDSNLRHAQASLEIQRITYFRLKRVQETDPRLVAQEDVDMALAKYQEAGATVHTFETMVGYTKIVAPFTGVITGRFADPGALIRAGGGDIGVDETSGLVSPGATEGAGGHRTGGGPVLTLAKIDQLRIYVYVPEGSCPLVRRGALATLRFDEFPNDKFNGKVVRYANALDLATRTMLTEIDLDNPKRVIYPRMYAHVKLQLVRHPDALRIPAGAIEGMGNTAHVLVIRDGQLATKPITTGIRDGNYVEILSGLTSKDLVVSSFSSALVSGEKVRFVVDGDKNADASADGNGVAG